ncbi:diphthine--ammonia ligase [Candidatus Woesearchaeota archaeon]|nr:diphthine--ammonia ligase [Candidatus Woesearchaeota archaeon]
MCGIVGVFGKNAETFVLKGLEMMQNRGVDAKGVIKLPNGAFGHCLHSMIGNVHQPLKGKGVLVANCEIYNWMELGHGKNDADVLLQLLDDEGCADVVLDSLDGVYAFAYFLGGKVWLARDVVGVKPLYYATKPFFAFASEKKVLECFGCSDARALHPRKILQYDGVVKIISRKAEFASSDEDVWSCFVSAVKKRVPEQKFGLMLAGIDSIAIAFVLKLLGKSFQCYTVGVRGCRDIAFAVAAAKALGLKLSVIEIDAAVINKLLPTVCTIAETSQVTEVEAGLITYVACLRAKQDGCKALFSGLGADEIFAGYERMQHGNSVKERISVLRRLFETSLYAHDVLSMNNSVELRLAYLDKTVISAAMSVSKEVFVQQCISAGMPKMAIPEKRLASQYGSGITNSFSSALLKTFCTVPVLKIAALVSGGKDSIRALQVMKDMNYEISCCITINSQNKDSYLYHTPNTHLAKFQCRTMCLPLLVVDSEGQKEKELADLKKALKQAIKKYGIEGVVSGALFSSYQRDRIEAVCEELGIVMFAPLWHKDQERQLREVINAGYEIIMTRVAADGLTKDWLGRKLTIHDISKLKKLRINVAGEGGEYETLVLNAPFFSKRIQISKSRIIEESENCATLEIIRAVLE